MAFDNEELDIGVKCIAAPVSDRAGWVVASNSISVPAQRFIPDAISHLGAEVRKAARETTKRLFLF